MTMSERDFTRAIMDASQPVPLGLLDGQARDAGRRFSVYRNNVAVSLTEALHTGFPVITKLLGTQNMDALAGMFLRQQPPSSPLMMHYGAGFPDFLASLEQLAHLGYLPDVARLELAIRRSYHAADAQPIAPDTLATRAPEELMASTVTFAPAVEILRSDWPLYDIWAFNMLEGADKPRAEAQDVIITRPDFDPTPTALPAGGADWIRALQDGRTVGTAHDLALQKVPEFDLGATLAILLQGGAICGLRRAHVE